jgi:hypothetical protein
MSSALTYGEMRSEEEQAVDRVVLARVRKGIELLKEKHGDDWVEKIDLRKLKLSNSSCCVLGQLYGKYENGCYQIWGRGTSRSDQPVEHGFMAHDWRMYNQESWLELQRAWVQELREIVGSR